jgi:hypothetical protein
MPYIGRGPELGVRSRFIYTATAGQTSFTGNDDAGISLAYTDTLYMDVYQNGVLLVPATDYAATTGTSVVLVQGASVDDTLELLVHDIFSVADSVSKKDGGAFSGNLSATDITATATLNAQGDTAAGDNAAIGYTAAEGLILTGQGSTNDVTIKNDADADVIEIPTGTVNVTMAGNLGVAGTLAVTGIHTVGENAIFDSEGGAVTQNLVQGLGKQWVRVSGSSMTVVDSYNTTSSTDAAQGKATIAIANDMANTSYACIFGGDDKQDGSGVFVCNIDQAVAQATTGYGMMNKKQTGSGMTLEDANQNMACLVMGDLA